MGQSHVLRQFRASKFPILNQQCWGDDGIAFHCRMCETCHMVSFATAMFLHNFDESP